MLPIYVLCFNKKPFYSSPSWFYGWKCYSAFYFILTIMVRITGPYRCTDQLLVWYVLSFTEHTNTQYIGVYWCTPHIGPLSDWYVPPVSSSMLRYIKPYLWYIRLLIWTKRSHKLLISTMFLSDVGKRVLLASCVCPSLPLGLEMVHFKIGCWKLKIYILPTFNQLIWIWKWYEMDSNSILMIDSRRYRYKNGYTMGTCSNRI